jgi:alkyldihydroxyacetonephosphate synthase
MVRVSDAAETSFNIGASVPRVLGGNVGRRVMRAAGLGEGAMVFVLCPGTASEARSTERRVDGHMRALRGRSLGSVPAKAWYHGRFRQPYARDVMMDRGLLVDTLETSVTWSRLPALHLEVRAALQQSFGVGRCIVGAHLSHLYHDGASAYFTFIAAPEPGRELERWRAAKRAVHAAIIRNGGTASHQHGVGTMHADLYEGLVSPLGADALRAMRDRLDPASTCNPGKLFERPADGQAAINAVRAPATLGDVEATSERDRS